MMDASGVYLFYDDVMLSKKIFSISLLLIASISLVACNSSFNFESEVQPPEDNGIPIPDVFGTEEETQPSTTTGNQPLINLLMLIAFGLVSLILLVIIGRR